MERFRVWLESKELEDQLREMGLILFFTFEGDVYGGTEAARMALAAIKKPTPIEKELKKEIQFPAFNLTKMMEEDSEKHERLFDHKDLNKIKIIDEAGVIKKLK